MSDFPIAECRSCHARIVWSTNAETGSRMPIDAKPALDGNITLTSGTNGPEARVLTKADAAQRQERGLTLWKSHHATCPQGAEWRRKRAAKS